MDIDAIPLFSAMKNRMAWLSRREAVVAQNIANSDTPDYQAQDLPQPAFQDLVGPMAGGVALRQTNSAHLTGHATPPVALRAKTDRHPMEAAPDGNTVVIEEQMAKLNDTAIAHRLTTQLYRKHLAMVRSALSAKQ